MEILFFFLLMSFVPALICSYIAGRRGRSRGGWFFAGLLLGPLAVLFALFMRRGRPPISGTIQEGSDLIAIPANTMKAMLRDLEAHPTIRRLFGPKPLEHLGVTSLHLRIETIANLSPRDEDDFLIILDEIISRVEGK